MGDGAIATSPVEVTVAADFGRLPVLRAVAETIAVLADFNLDDVSDIKLAVDEVCSQLIKDALTGAALICKFVVAGGAIEVEACVDTSSRTIPDERGFGWHVLQELTDDISVSHLPLGSDDRGYRTSIVFTKRMGGDA
ncbi:ATP-binding protein [Rhodococcus sp. NPDC003322]